MSGLVVNLSLDSDSPIVLPKYYNHVLQGFFYRNIDTFLSEFLHNVGFIHGNRRFKLFTFSKIFGRHTETPQGKLLFKPPITISFSSPFLQLMESLLNTALPKLTLKLSESEVFISEISSTEYSVANPCKVKCLSPITVYKTPEATKRFHYLSPFEEEFYELLKSNLLKKYYLVHGKNYKGELEIKPIRVKKSGRRKILFKNTLIEAWEGIYVIIAKEEMIKIALYAGLGSKNSAGFGMVEPC